MKYALSLPNGKECGHPAKLAEFARIAEDTGWDAVFLEDYIIWQGHNNAETYDPWVSLAAMALSTKTIRLGTMVTAIARRRPWKLARETAAIDHLSGGRLILGIGVGETKIDTSFSGFGEETDAKRRARMADEALELLNRFWSGRQITFDGEFYHVKKIRLLPKPVQNPRIPVWIGGVWPLQGPVRRALRWDGACLYKKNNADFTPADIRELARLAAGRPKPRAPFDIAAGHAYWQQARDRGREKAYVESLAEAGATWWSVYFPPDAEKKMLRCIMEGPVRID